MERVNERRHILELDLQKARYEASLAERRYAACDPDNRLIAAQLEKSWEAALRRVEECQTRLEPETRAIGQSVGGADFVALAKDLETAWASPNVPMRSRQQLLRTLVVDIIADIDEAARDVILTIHWRGGQHSQLRVRKPKTGEHGCQTPDEALAVMRSMAARWPDEHIAASLNRMGTRTGQGKTWTAHRVSSLRRVHGIHAYLSAQKDGEWLTMREAAATLRVTPHTIRRLIKTGVLPAVQVVPGAPHQIRSGDLQSQAVSTAIARKGRPCRSESAQPLPMFPDTSWRAAMRWKIVLEGTDEFGSAHRSELTIDKDLARLSAGEIGFSVEDGKAIMAHLQQVVVKQQCEAYVLTSRFCVDCEGFRRIKDYSKRKIRTVFGRVEVRNPRIMNCQRCLPHFCAAWTVLRDICPDQATPELMERSARLGSLLPYRKAAEVMAEFLPIQSTESFVTLRHRTLKLGQRLDERARERAWFEPPSTAERRQMELDLPNDSRSRIRREYRYRACSRKPGGSRQEF